MIDASFVGLVRLLSTIGILVSGTLSTEELVAKVASDVVIRCPQTTCKYRRRHGDSAQVSFPIESTKDAVKRLVSNRISLAETISTAHS